MPDSDGDYPHHQILCKQADSDVVYVFNSLRNGCKPHELEISNLQFPMSSLRSVRDQSPQTLMFKTLQHRRIFLSQQQCMAQRIKFADIPITALDCPVLWEPYRMPSIQYPKSTAELDHDKQYPQILQVPRYPRKFSSGNQVSIVVAEAAVLFQAYQNFRTQIDMTRT